MDVRSCGGFGSGRPHQSGRRHLLDGLYALSESPTNFGLSLLFLCLTSSSMLWGKMMSGPCKQATLFTVYLDGRIPRMAFEVVDVCFARSWNCLSLENYFCAKAEASRSATRWGGGGQSGKGICAVNWGRCWLHVCFSSHGKLGICTC